MPIVDKFIGSYDFIDNDGYEFLLKTNKDAPNFKIISMNILDAHGVNGVRLSPDPVCTDGHYTTVGYRLVGNACR